MVDREPLKRDPHAARKPEKGFCESWGSLRTLPPCLPRWNGAQSVLRNRHLRNPGLWEGAAMRQNSLSFYAFYAGVFCLCMCVLMLEIIQVRLLSVTTYYHIAFFAISMAMFDMTAGAVWSISEMSVSLIKPSTTI
jgi:hypothetical protein